MRCYRCLKNITPEDIRYGLHTRCFNMWFYTSDRDDFQDIVSHSMGSREPEIGENKFSEIASSFFQGKFKKYSAKLGEKSYILKIQEEDYPELPQTEYLCNQIAEMLAIEIPPYYLISFDNKVPTFLSENFMHKKEASNLLHIYHFLDDVGQYNCESLYKIILQKTQKMSDAKCFIECTLFDALIGNHDRHGRNLALIQSHMGYALSPLYDNPSNLGIEIEALLGAQLEPRGKIATYQTDEPSITDYIVEWQRLGQEEHVMHFYKKINIQKILKKIENGFIQEKRKNALIRLVSKRYTEYKNAIVG